MSDRRSTQELRAAYEEHRDKVWWNVHRDLRRDVEAGRVDLGGPEGEACFKAGIEAAKRLEEKYGLDNLKCDGYDLGLVSGRMSALAWVLGAEWEESLDT